jgi:hypothetical protein
MRLALTASVLVPVCLGAAAVLAALVVGLIVMGHKRTAEPAQESVGAEPEAAAEALAVKDADTAPLPVQSAAYLSAVPEPRTPTSHDENGATPRPAATASTPPEEPDMTDSHGESQEPDEPRKDEKADSEAPAAGSIPHARPKVSVAGSSRTVAAAVAQALAVRAAVDRPAGSEAAQESTPRAEPVATVASRVDVRDRLLAVLLDDPVRAVGAAVELETCRGQLERLSEAVRHERKSLGDALTQLAGAGLRPDQLAKLAGLPVDDVQEMLKSDAQS